jgi:RHS repeat-associated protein
MQDRNPEVNKARRAVALCGGGDFKKDCLKNMRGIFMNSYARTGVSAARAVTGHWPRTLFSRILPLLALACWMACPAPASALTISSGQVVTGTIANGTQVDTYTITPSVIVGTGLVASLGTDGTAGVSLNVQVLNSGGAAKCNVSTSTNPAFPFFAYCEVTSGGVTTGGAWTVKVKRSSGTTGAGYRLTFLMVPAATAIPSTIGGSTAGGLMYPGTTYSGSVDRGDIQIWMTNSLKVNSGIATLTWTGGGTGSIARVQGFGPTGTGGGFSPGVSAGSPTGTLTYAGLSFPAGTSVLVVSKNSGVDGPVSYTLSVAGAAVTLPVQAQADGAFCVTCNDKKQSLANAQAIANTQGGTNAGDPINIATGNLYETATDYSTYGQNPLALTRTYNSQSYQRNIYPSLIGSNWRTNYDRYLRLVSSVFVTAERPGGEVINFRCNVTSKVCTPDTDMDYSLSYSGTTYTLTDPDDTVETYTSAAGKGTLSTIALRNGYTQTMNYTAGVLTSVSDSYSRSLSFTYTGGVVTGVTTPDAATLTYGYIAFASAGTNLLQSVTYNTSPTTKQTYLYEDTQLPYTLTGITDENNKRYATWTHDGSNRALSSALGGLGANQTSISYVSTGNVVTGPLGIQNTYKFLNRLNVPQVKEIDRAANSPVVAATSTITYDSSGYRNSVTDWNGNVTNWVNNSHGLPTQISYSSNTSDKQIVTLTYDFWYPRLPHTIAGTGLTSNFTYDSSGNQLTRTDKDTTTSTSPYVTTGQTRTWTNTWNATGQLLTVQQPRTDVTIKTTYAYTGGTLTSITDALNHVTNIGTATGGGYPKKVTDWNGILTTHAYNNRMWPTSSVMTVSAGTLTTSYTYDSAGNLTKTTWPDSSFISTAYDNAHRPITTTNALSETSNITYDSAGNVTQTLVRNASSVTKYKHTATWDALGEKLTDVGGQGQSTSFTYDKNSNVLTVTDPLSHVTTNTYDTLNRLSTYKNAVQDLSSIKYDSNSRPLTVKDGRSNSTTYVYDGFGDTIQQNSPDSLKTITFYDGDANVTGVNQSGINFSSATYDKLDRPITRTYSGDSSLNVSILYDSSGHGYGVGHMTGGTDATGSFSRNYDERGHVTSDARTISSQVYTTGYTYESAGRLSSITYASSGWVINYGRDSAGQISYVSATQPSHGAVNLASYVKHMPFGPASSWTYGNGVTDTRAFDLDYRMTGVKDVGSSNIQYLSYSYNADNNPTTITDNVTGGNTQTLTYDAIDRLKSATGAYGTVSSITYDSNSNRKTYGAISYTIPGANDRMSVANGSNITYISTGNVNGIGTNSMTYNQANQLKTAVISGTTSTYTYDFAGIRAKIKTGTNPFQITQYDLNGHLLTETSQAATPVETDYVYMDGMPLSVIQPAAATISALHTDTIGTVQRATDSTKTINWTGNYNPNGAVTPTTTITMNERLSNYHADSTGVYYAINRTYDPSTVTPRYWQVDLLGIAPGLNPYLYADNNPFKWIDLLGLYDYTNQETKQLFLDPALNDATSGMFSGLWNIYNNSKVGGRFDFKNNSNTHMIRFV